ncbi:MAG: hypothetical protein KUG69_05405 [Marinosulfonomonas sp.]|nr:hypothetical protein [Marinosulfonomonas sp.]
MNQAEPIGLLNTGLPVTVLAVLAIVLPRLLAPSQTRSHRLVGSAVGLSALVLLVVGAIIFAATYSVQGHPVLATFKSDPLAIMLFFLRLAAKASLIWLPVLGLVWFGMAQKVENHRGADVARKDLP